MAEKLLVVVDPQNDFVDGALGVDKDQVVAERIARKILQHTGEIIVTMDTHRESYYLKSEEGKNLPIPHCIYGTHGWKINDKIQSALDCKRYFQLNKIGFGLMLGVRELTTLGRLGWMEIEFVGYVTDICVIANVLVFKSVYTNTHIILDSSCCAGTSKEAHDAALLVMKSCHVEVV